MYSPRRPGSTPRPARPGRKPPPPGTRPEYCVAREATAAKASSETAGGPSLKDLGHSEDPADPVGGSCAQASQLRGSIPAGTIGGYDRTAQNFDGPRPAPGCDLGAVRTPSTGTDYGVCGIRS